MFLRGSGGHQLLWTIWGIRQETARRVRQRIRATLRWAQAHGYVEQNVTDERIDGALPKMPAVKSHFLALPYQNVLAALEAVEATGTSIATKLCFRFLVQTAVRSGEARGATSSPDFSREVENKAVSRGIIGLL